MNFLKTRFRVLEGIVDYSIFYLLVFIYLWSFGRDTGNGQYVLEGAGIFPIVVFWFMYFPIIEGVTCQTIGKKIMNSTVVKLNGSDYGILDSFVRRLLDPVDLIFFGLVGLLVMKSSEKGQRIGDIVAGTIVIGFQDAHCQNCHEKLTLNSREIAKNEYRCPECGFHNEM